MLAATLEDDSNHIVAATALDLDGNVHVGVGSHRVINDGPCAELVVLGIAASTHADWLATVVAVGDGCRGVVPFCGQCSQVKLDQHPDICVLVPIKSASIRELLPAPTFSPMRPTHGSCVSIGLGSGLPEQPARSLFRYVR